jgi:hypothetical protein
LLKGVEKNQPNKAEKNATIAMPAVLLILFILKHILLLISLKYINFEANNLNEKFFK